jgi:glyoxylase-like metal-dependent hydrolase (beta-lactamase superfamily II)
MIDPGFYKSEAEKIFKEMDHLDLEIESVVNSHAHLDHVSGNQLVKEISGASLLVHELDASMLLLPPDKILKDGSIIQVGDIKFKILHTPGHTLGSICLLAKSIVLTGDTLFFGSIGSGNRKMLLTSIKEKLMGLPHKTRVYPGHGLQTTIGEEKRNNPFLVHL